MRMRKEREPKNPEQRTASKLAQMITHLEIAKQLGVTAETLRRWVKAVPPKFPAPKMRIGDLWFYREADVKRFWATGSWDRPVE
jgi:predicted site-specific integrase-resolvase